MEGILLSCCIQANLALKRYASTYLINKSIPSRVLAYNQTILMIKFLILGTELTEIKLPLIDEYEKHEFTLYVNDCLESENLLIRNLISS